MTSIRFRQFAFVTAGVAVWTLISWAAFVYGFMPIAFLVAVAGAIVLAIYRPRWLVLATVAELTVGGKGYMLFWAIHGQHLSIRLAMFLIIFVAAMVKLIRHRRWPYPRAMVWPILALVLWVGIMSGVGLLRGNGLPGVFLDANAFLYLGTFWSWWAFWYDDPQWPHNAILVLAAGTTVMALTSWLTTLWFAQGWFGLSPFYHWIRDTGQGEITLIANGVYRVFFQSQIYGVFVLLLLLGGWTRQRLARWWLVPMTAAALGAYIGLSRSLWLGLAAGVAVLGIFLLLSFGWRTLRRWWVLLPMGILVVGMVAWAINFPGLWGRGGNAALFARVENLGATPAVNARQNQFWPLVHAIKPQFIFGRGFGTSVTYFNPDPRIHAWRTTAAFELGYLDLWLKFGLVGLGILGWWLVELWRAWRKKSAWWLISGGITALLVIHLTSPYINHPLGIGWLVFASCLAYTNA